MKKTIALILALALCLCLSAAAFADYKTLTTDYEVWQEYAGEQYAAEDYASKEIAYKFSADVPGERMNLSLMMNLYEDGSAVLSQYRDGVGLSFLYYGYWANLEDEIFAAFTTYQYMGETVEGQAEHGALASVDYTYDLIADEEGAFAFGLNYCLGFADGGQYVRNADIVGDGEIVFADEEAFLTGSADFWANNQ